MERNRSDGEGALDEPAGTRGSRSLAGAALMQMSVTKAIEKALFVEWARVGYAALSMESIARVAGVGKAAIYRRWPSKLALLTDVFTRVGVSRAVAPNTGSLTGDVEALLRYMRRLLHDPIVARILPDLHAEMPRNQELAAVVRGELQMSRRAKAEQIFLRAVERGELPGTLDTDMAADLVGGMIYWRMIVTRQCADSRYIKRLVDTIVAGLRASPG